MSPAALALALLLASPSTGAKDEASGLLNQPEAYRFEKDLQCGSHLLPPSVCYPDPAYQILDEEFRRLQAVEKDAKAAGKQRLTFFIVGAVLGSVLGLSLGGTIAWLLIHH